MIFKDLKLIFLHVPKTGGTSIRAAILETFGRDRVYSDYADRIGNLHSPVNVDPQGYLRRTEAEGYPELQGMAAVVGHFWPKKYQSFSGCLRATVLRHPLDRAISHYFYRLSRSSHLGVLDMTFEQFVAQEKISSLYHAIYFRDVDMGWFDLVLDYDQLRSDWDKSMQSLGLSSTQRHELNTTGFKLDSYPEQKAALLADHRLLARVSSILATEIFFFEKHIQPR